ncbi:hypothetical protein CONLIGDRAFT_708799 [Coniochaeta ligniaria NRRL 30616]|uniref:Trichothecene 3-O-acetyltransferase-like N-terminal domain-containing protein n=1 Tax=Coniochaeta ligniaria NRRL 30616 TaxID=1408157 RepID=A0A1J7IXX0_9PEZI|nr:hypothetical protein CONLIGDRAFT_708799 [Coniochaeta ligniaria NRRL 30616]
MGSHDGLYAEADIMGQFPVLNSYSMLAYGFELPPDVNRDAVVSALQISFDKLVEQIPWLGWQVATSESGVRTVLPWPHDVAKERVRVKICDDSIVPMEQLLAEKVPINRLHGKELCPWPALPQPHGLTGPAPVVALQASFVRGGLIINLTAHHTVMDGTADFQFLHLFATVLNGGEIPAADLEQANRDRNRLVPLIPHGEPVKDHSHLRPPPGWKFVMPTSWPTWCYFLMSVASLAEIVKTARDADTESSSIERISSDDILSAFYWKRICALRLARGMPRDTESKISRAINARTPLGIPSSYMGAQVYPAITRMLMGRVDELTVPQLARILRRELLEAATPWAVRSFATFIERESPEDRARLLYTGTHNSNTDVGATNVSRLVTPKGPWGPLLGPCRFYRRPNTGPIPGAFRIQEPENGAHPIAVCLPEEDLKALKKDEEWGRYATCIG